jgi:hypothetical protein
MDLYANDRSWSVKVGTGGHLLIADGSWDAVILAPSRPVKESLETSGIAGQPKPTGALYSKRMDLNCLVLDARERNRYHHGRKTERCGNRFCW